MLKRMSLKWRACAGLALCTAIALLPARAHAEAGAAQKAAAESLFDEGVKAIKSGRYADACPKLEESERIDPGIGTLLYLGECYERIGRSASAWATFREAASSAQAQSEGERARIAESRADRLQPRLSKLTLQVAPETRQLSGLRITRDNAPIDTSLLGVAIPVDPGKYHFVASAEGYESFETDLEVGANGDAKTLQIPALKAAPKPAAPAPQAGPPSVAYAATTGVPRPEEAKPARAPKSRMRTAAFVTGALGVVWLGVGSYFGVHAIAKNSDAESYCPRGNLCDSKQGVTLTHDAKQAAVLSNITIGIGAAFVVAGVVLYVTSEPQRAARLELHPLVSRDLAGVGFGGAFR